MMKQKALLIKVNKIIEEEVTLKICEFELIGFANIIPYQLEQGNEYDVYVGITILDNFQITELNKKTKSVERINKSFKYLIRGILKEGGIIDAGVVFQDEMFEEYTYLIDKYIEIEVDRISVEFI